MFQRRSVGKSHADRINAVVAVHNWMLKDLMATRELTFLRNEKRMQPRIDLVRRHSVDYTHKELVHQAACQRLTVLDHAAGRRCVQMQVQLKCLLGQQWQSRIHSAANQLRGSLTGQHCGGTQAAKCQPCVLDLDWLAVDAAGLQQEARIDNRNIVIFAP